MVIPVRILFAASECTPIVKVGGLGDVIGSLPKALEKLGDDVRVIIPLYQGVKNGKGGKRGKSLMSFSCNFAKVAERVNVYQAHLPNSPVVVYLLENGKYLGSGGVYLSRDAFAVSQKEIDRFAFFSEAVVEFIKHSQWKPQIVHCHDYHTGIIPHLLREMGEIKTVFTIHNLANQGISQLSVLKKLGHGHHLPDLNITWDARDDNLDLVLQGILGADLITTVSPSYAREIQTSKFGEGLHEVIKTKRKKLVGIINGIDDRFFDPTTDEYLFANYSIGDVIEGKLKNKKDLQKRLGFKADSEAPLMAAVSRLSEQKGFEILLELPFNQIEAQFVILGVGGEVYEERLKALAKVNLNLIFVNRFDEELAHQIYAGSDFFLMPSRFEPCGLGQMIAMRYGTLPIVNAVGGLKDTVKDGVTGLVMRGYSAKSLAAALGSAQDLYCKDKDQLVEMIKKAMQKDFSWQKSASKFQKIYRSLLGGS